MPYQSWTRIWQKICHQIDPHPAHTNPKLFERIVHLIKGALRNYYIGGKSECVGSSLVLSNRFSNKNKWRPFCVTHLSALNRMCHLCFVQKLNFIGGSDSFCGDFIWCCGEMSTWWVLQLRPSLKIVPGTPCLQGGTRINAMIIAMDWHQGAKRLIKLRYWEFYYDINITKKKIP